MAKKILLYVQEPKTNDGLSDLDRLTRAFQNELGRNEIVFPLPVIQSIADALRSRNGKVTMTYIKDETRFLLINTEAGDTTSVLYGIAVDIGTTTISVQLISLFNGKAVATVTDYNSQVKCGLDVISRINYAKRPERLQELRNLVLETINKLIFKLCDNKQIKTSDISDSVISGNTTMIHLLLGLNPEYIRLEPYTPTLLKIPHLVASEIGIDVNPNSLIYFSPAVGSYVGGDITAGVLCTDLATDTQDIHLFIDIGTNGEIVAGNSDFLLACACSAETCIRRWRD